MRWNIDSLFVLGAAGFLACASNGVTKKHDSHFQVLSVAGSTSRNPAPLTLVAGSTQRIDLDPTRDLKVDRVGPFLDGMPIEQAATLCGVKLFEEEKNAFEETAAGRRSATRVVFCQAMISGQPVEMKLFFSEGSLKQISLQREISGPTPPATQRWLPDQWIPAVQFWLDVIRKAHPTSQEAEWKWQEYYGLRSAPSLIDKLTQENQTLSAATLLEKFRAQFRYPLATDFAVYLGERSDVVLRLEEKEVSVLIDFHFAPQRQQKEQEKREQEKREKPKQDEQQKPKEEQQNLQEQASSSRLAAIQKKVVNPFPEFAGLPFGTPKADVLRWVKKKGLRGCLGLGPTDIKNPQKDIDCPVLAFAGGPSIVRFGFDHQGFLFYIDLTAQPARRLLTSMQQARPHALRFLKHLRHYVGDVYFTDYGFRKERATDATVLSQWATENGRGLELEPEEQSAEYNLFVFLSRVQDGPFLPSSFAFHLSLGRSLP